MDREAVKAADDETLQKLGVKMGDIIALTSLL